MEKVYTKKEVTEYVFLNKDYFLGFALKLNKGNAEKAEDCFQNAIVYLNAKKDFDGKIKYLDTFFSNAIRFVFLNSTQTDVSIKRKKDYLGSL